MTKNQTELFMALKSIEKIYREQNSLQNSVHRFNTRATYPEAVEFYDFIDNLNSPEKQTHIIFLGRSRSGKSNITANIVSYLDKHRNENHVFNCMGKDSYFEDVVYYDFLKKYNKNNSLHVHLSEELPLVYQYDEHEYRSLIFSEFSIDKVVTKNNFPSQLDDWLKTNAKIKLCFVYDDTQRNYESVNKDEVLTSIYDYIMKDETIDKTNISCKLILTKQDMYPTQFEEFRDLSRNFLNKNIPNFTASFLPHDSANDFMFYHVYSNVTQSVESNDDVTDEKLPALTSIKKLETEDYTLAQQLFDWILN